MIDIVIGFDTTGSMSPVISETRRKIKEVTTRLFTDIPDLRLGIVAFGDYCDMPKDYFQLNLTNNKNDIIEFINKNHQTGGGDGDEYYELVIKKVREEFNWNKDAKKIFILIGDAEPHKVGYKYNNITYNIDWKEEATLSIEQGITIYGIQALGYKSSKYFYEEISRKTNGTKLDLAQFQHINQYLQAIIYKNTSEDLLDNYENEVKKEYAGNKLLSNMFNKLRNRTEVISEHKYYDASGLELIPVNPSRFQILHIDNTTTIKDFVTSTGAVFKTGKGFYQFTKPELIQERKEVVLRDKITGDMFTGDKARLLIGIEPGEKKKLKPTDLEKYDIFVQSTSYTRKLLSDTLFLYEMDVYED